VAKRRAYAWSNRKMFSVAPLAYHQIFSLGALRREPVPMWYAAGPIRIWGEASP
jgi:hypothetical protein